jgi:psp operon transcriptional activator
LATAPATAIAPPPTALIGEAPSFLAMLEHVSRAAKLAKPVLVIGERGTGKELIASRLHYLSPRWEQPIVKVNCAALTETLLETELFGHQAGAFTGATRTHIGRFEQANGGTLVLDELGTIPLRMQEKILRVIEYGEFQRVGGTETITTDVRIVGATNEHLPRLAETGRFRADLLDRLAFDVIYVPPLRARPEDIDTLAYHFAVNVTSELKRSFFPGFTPDAKAALLGYRWPGNVRELKNAVERSVYRAVEPDKPIGQILFDPFASPFSLGTIQGEPAASSPAQPQPAVVTPLRDHELPDDFREAVADFEQQLLKRALERAQFKQTTAAKLLGLSYHQLRSLLRKHALTKSSDAEADTDSAADDAE